FPGVKRAVAIAARVTAQVARGGGPALTVRGWGPRASNSFSRAESTLSPGPFARSDSSLKRSGPSCRTLRIKAFHRLDRISIAVWNERHWESIRLGIGV